MDKHIRREHRPVIFTVSLLSLLISTPALAYTVNVNSSIPVTTQVVPQLSTANGTLTEIATTQHQVGAAINASGDKVASMIEQAEQARATQESFARQSDRLEQSRRNFAVPETICTESTSGAAARVNSQARATQSGYTRGSGVSNRKLKDALTEATPAPEQVQYQSAALHSQWCDETDYAAYGGTDLCPAVSQYPGGDKQLSSLLDGAGKPGKTPDLTFSQTQIDAAVAYTLNTTAPAAGRQPGKDEVKTASGKQYAGLMTQYEGIMDAAREPQMAMIAASSPNAATRDALKDALKVPSAQRYFDDTASQQAKSSGELSQREFESFEVGRRYASTAYLSDLQQMEGDNLIRELIRVQSLGNWLALGIKREQEKNNILTGQLLALRATEHYRPQLAAKMEQVKAGTAR
ncbi:conjugal transfer protein [Salmonella enterica]|uniref:conjugal transfer protein TraW n=1 Tax=Salmonella enterica TaxID=28901 RepID=UPI00193C88A2|nr:conjugal transfer protein TraW [Salmonella enterica]EAS3780363.1 conjugal transfer protein [Salmonella enterica]EDW2060603.1 conjugal transfer protein TraW [Salmonella enterica subsp. enterica serovar Oslo]EDY1997988.1 conjugal transfer protein TraW [Salmonella enterica subsp. diarizonae]EIO3282842.1 conjugal transfer protein TraW [Salmonella enterica]